VAQETIAPREDARFGPLKAKAEEIWRGHNLKLMRLLEKDAARTERVEKPTRAASRRDSFSVDPPPAVP
jgi:hypothetical protein